MGQGRRRRRRREGDIKSDWKNSPDFFNGPASANQRTSQGRQRGQLVDVGPVVLLTALGSYKPISSE